MQFYEKTLPYFLCRLLLAYSGEKEQQLSFGINFLRQLDLQKVRGFLDNIWVEIDPGSDLNSGTGNGESHMEFSCPIYTLMYCAFRAPNCFMFLMRSSGPKSSLAPRHSISGKALNIPYKGPRASTPNLWQPQLFICHRQKKYCQHQWGSEIHVTAFHRALKSPIWHCSISVSTPSFFP